MSSSGFISLINICGRNSDHVAASKSTIGVKNKSGAKKIEIKKKVKTVVTGLGHPDPQNLCAWERIRLDNIIESNAMMLKFGLIEPEIPKVKKLKKPKKVIISEPERRSERLKMTQSDKK